MRTSRFNVLSFPCWSVPPRDCPPPVAVQRFEELNRLMLAQRPADAYHLRRVQDSHGDGSTQSVVRVGAEASARHPGSPRLEEIRGRSSRGVSSSQIVQNFVSSFKTSRSCVRKR